jgi:hypothetical protein
MQHKGKNRWMGRLAALGLASALFATPAAAGPNSGKIEFSVGMDFTTAYFFRGILQERNGFIWQPYGEVNINLYSDEDENAILTAFTPFVGTWNSVHSEATAAVSGPSNWYESDVYIGAKFTLFNKLEVKPFYIAYTYPNGAFDTVQEFDLAFSLDDSEWLGTFALNPNFLWAHELENTALGTKRGDYMEFNIAPSFTILESEDYPVSLTVPAQLGIGIDNYYEGPFSNSNETFGFFRGGLIFSVPLAFMGEDYGAWSASAGAYVYTFGNVNKVYNRNNDPWVVGTWSINMTY